MIMIIAGAYT